MYTSLIFASRISRSRTSEGTEAPQRFQWNMTIGSHFNPTVRRHLPTRCLKSSSRRRRRFLDTCVCLLLLLFVASGRLPWRYLHCLAGSDKKSPLLPAENPPRTQEGGFCLHRVAPRRVAAVGEAGGDNDIFFRVRFSFAPHPLIAPRAPRTPDSHTGINCAIVIGEAASNE